MKGHYLLGTALIHLERYDDALGPLQTVGFHQVQNISFYAYAKYLGSAVRY